MAYRTSSHDSRSHFPPPTFSKKALPMVCCSNMVSSLPSVYSALLCHALPSPCPAMLCPVLSCSVLSCLVLPFLLRSARLCPAESQCMNNWACSVLPGRPALPYPIMYPGYTVARLFLRPFICLPQTNASSRPRAGHGRQEPSRRGGRSAHAL